MACHTQYAAESLSNEQKSGIPSNKGEPIREGTSLTNSLIGAKTPQQLAHERRNENRDEALERKTEEKKKFTTLANWTVAKSRIDWKKPLVPDQVQSFFQNIPQDSCWVDPYLVFMEIFFEYSASSTRTALAGKREVISSFCADPFPLLSVPVCVTMVLVR